MAENRSKRIAGPAGLGLLWGVLAAGFPLLWACGTAEEKGGIEEAGKPGSQESKKLEEAEKREPAVGKPGPGVIVKTASGLQYEDILVGTGRMAIPRSKVLVNYVGRLEDGTEFDSNLPDGPPFEVTLEVSNVIRGWHEGLRGMREGGKRRLIIPPDLGYGEAGSPPKIPANAVLIFEVDLLEVK
jgi:FKBP-type peptidyl-prolyl cis-trans isomerase